MNETTMDTGRHPVNVGHLVMGLAFAGVLGVWALIEGDVVGENARWLFGVPWVVAGAAGLLVAALSGTRRGRNAPPAYDSPRATDTDPTDTDSTGTTDPTEEIR